MTETAPCTIATRHLIAALKMIETVRQDSHIPAIATAILDLDDVPTIRATDLDQELTVILSALCREKMRLAIDPPTLITALGNCPDRTSIRAEGDAALLTSGRVSVRGPTGIDLTDLPEMDGGQPVATFDIPQQTLHAGLRAVSFAISTEETRYYLNGVLLTAVDGNLTLVATDGHRMVRHILDQPYSGPDMIIPAVTVQTLLKLLQRGPSRPAHITVGIIDRNCQRGTPHDRHALTISAPGWILKSKCIDGVYPNWSRLVEKALVETGDTPAIRTTVTQSQASRLPKHNSWRRVTINPDEGTMRLLDDFEREVVAMPLAGTGAEFCVSAHFLRQMVGTIGDVELASGTTDAPLLARPKNPATLALLMPMRKSEPKSRK